MLFIEPNTGRMRDTRRPGGTGTSRGNITRKMMRASTPHSLQTRRPKVKIIEKMREIRDPRERQRGEVSGIRKYITRETVIMETDNALHIKYIHVENKFKIFPWKLSVFRLEADHVVVLVSVQDNVVPARNRSLQDYLLLISGVGALYVIVPLSV